jgi:forkhead box protein O3
MMAISSSNDKQLTLAEIYDWMATNVPGLEAQRHVHSSKGWKNAVRHTLSINKRFKKIGRLGRPGWWTLEPSKNDMTRDYISKDILSTAMVSFEPLDEEPQSFRPRSYSEPQCCLSQRPVISYNHNRKLSTGNLRLEHRVTDDGTVGVMNIPSPVVLQSAQICDASTQTDTIEIVVQQRKPVEKNNFETNFHYMSSFFDSLPPTVDCSLDTSQFYDPKFDTFLNNKLAFL